MRRLPWLVRLGLFAVGFGVGLSNNPPPSTSRPILIEIRMVSPEDVSVPASMPRRFAGQPPSHGSCLIEHSFCPEMKRRL
jgi:hypothetical protein